MASYSFKKDDLDKPKDDTGIKFPKGIRHEKKMIEVERKNNKLHGFSDKEISRKANEVFPGMSFEKFKGSVNSKGTNHGVRTGKRGGTYNERTSKNGTSYRQYF